MSSVLWRFSGTCFSKDIKMTYRDFTGGLVAKTELLVQEAQVHILVKELNPIYHNQDLAQPINK